MKRVYLDSNVLISSMREEMDCQLRPLYLEADNFLSKAATANIRIIVSELFLDEVKDYLKISKKDIYQYFTLKGTKTETVETNTDFARIMESKGIHFPDSVHASTAIASNCECIITFNKKDFKPAKKWIQILLPEEF